VQFLFHLFRAHGIVLKDLFQSLIVKRRIYPRQLMDIGQLSEVIAGKDIALPDMRRERVHTDAQPDIWLFYEEKPVGIGAAIPVSSQPPHQPDAALIDKLCCIVEYRGIDMHPHRFTDDEIAGPTLLSCCTIA
jgi:hypothetical protein